MTKQADTRDNLLSIRFIGNELETKAVPIYELGQVLISIQRIVNKAYLFREGRLELDSQLSDDEQRLVSLQIASRFKKSDGYGLIPFFTDPATIEIVKTVLTEGIKVLGTYALAKVELKKEQKKKEIELGQKREAESQTPSQQDNKPSQIFVSAVYNDIKVLTERFDNRGDITNIELALVNSDLPPVTIGLETKEYVKYLENQPVLGETQDISGIIERLDQFRLIAEVRLSAKRIIKVHLEPDFFETARYKVGKNQTVTFTGRPIMKLGARSKFKEFEAYKITLNKKGHNS